MKKWFLNLSLILFFTLSGAVFAQEADNKLEKVRTQIHILNLLNGLELDKNQMRLILDMANQAETMRQEYKNLIAQKENQINSAYNEVLEVVKNGTVVIPEDIAFKVHRIGQEVDKIKETAQKELTALVAKVKDVLRPHQLYVLDDYKPCIIPPVKQGRIGQADDPQGFVKALERVYGMPQERYSSRRDEIVQKAIDRMKSKVPVGFIIDEEKLKGKLLKAMDETRQMSEVDFALKKEEIAKEIKAQLLPEKPPINIGIKIERLLLQPEIIPILTERLASKN